MRKAVLLVLAVACLALAWAVPVIRAADAPRMSAEQLKSVLTDPGVVIIDVRQEVDWAESKAKIAGAVRENPATVATWMSKYPKDKTIVLYCA